MAMSIPTKRYRQKQIYPQRDISVYPLIVSAPQRCTDAPQRCTEAQMHHKGELCNIHTDLVLAWYLQVGKNGVLAQILQAQRKTGAPKRGIGVGTDVASAISVPMQLARYLTMQELCQCSWHDIWQCNFCANAVGTNQISYISKEIYEILDLLKKHTAHSGSLEAYSSIWAYQNRRTWCCTWERRTGLELGKNGAWPMFLSVTYFHHSIFIR